jgi:hypothetical protein
MVTVFVRAAALWQHHVLSWQRLDASVGWYMRSPSGVRPHTASMTVAAGCAVYQTSSGLYHNEYCIVLIQPL